MRTTFPEGQTFLEKKEKTTIQYNEQTSKKGR